jgi:hypothetical protein
VSDFDIYLDTDNELKFTVAIEGAHEAQVRSQFILEGPKGINLCFEGKPAGGEIAVEVPSLKGMLREGLYNTRLEVIVDDRVFTPLQMQANLKPAIKVEAVVRTAQRVAGPVVTATVVNKSKPLVESPAPPLAPVAAPVPVRVAPPVPKQPAAPVSRPVTPAPAPVPRPAPPSRKASSLDNLLDSLEDV